MTSDTELDTRLVQPIAPTLRAPFYRHYGKRALDVLLVVATSFIVMPVVALMAMIVASDGHNPFYSQQRVGRGGRSFRMWKLRSMVPNAKEKLEPYLAANPEARAEWDQTQKLKNDPRITRIGRIIRKTSLDELPQLFNVLKGEMSLVGPRPMMPEQRNLYPGQGYFRQRPGITGLWQVSDRNDCEFHARAGFDDTYDRSVSFRTDAKILVATVGVVLNATGH